MSNKWNWETAKTSYGAGIIIVRKFNSVWKVLGLWSRVGYDIPKGHIEPGEDILSTALRETKEEAGIDDLQFIWGKKAYIEDNLIVFLAVTEQDIDMLKNPEHDYANWLDWDEMVLKTYSYLKPAIINAKGVVCS